MKKKSTLFHLIIFISILFGACKKGNKDAYPAPDLFSVSIGERDITYAAIIWKNTKAFDGSKVSYKITLEGKTIVAGLSDTTYRITGLTGDNGYHGAVIAEDNHGNTVSADFSIGEATGYVFFTRWDDRQYHCYTIAGDPKWQINEELSGEPAASHDTVFARGFTKICALSAQTGKVFWSVPVTGIDNVLYDHGLVYTTIPGKQIIALEAATGRLKWSYSTTSRYNLIIGDGVLLAANSDGLGGEVLAIDASTGTYKWRITTPSTTYAPRPANGLVFLQYDSGSGGTNFNQSYFAAYDIQTGQQRWRIAYLGTLVGGVIVRPTAIGNHVYFAGYRDYFGNINTLYAVSTSTGSINWQIDLGAGSGPVIGAGADIYVENVRYDAITGKRLGQVGQNGDFAITNRQYVSLLNYSSSPSRDYFAVYNFQYNAVFSRLQKIMPFGSFIVMGNDGKFYYPGSSAMFNMN